MQLQRKNSKKTQALRCFPSPDGATAASLGPMIRWSGAAAHSPLLLLSLLSLAPLACSAGGGEGTQGGSGGSKSGASTGGADSGSGGGLVGLAGSPGTGGDDSGSGGNASSESGVGCAGADIWCETFESVAEGATPGDDWSSRPAHCDQGTRIMAVATDQPRGASKKALKVTDHQLSECRISRAFPSTNDFWIRAYIRWDEAVSFEGKEILALDMHPSLPQPKDDPALRFGNRAKEPCVGAPGPQITMIGLGAGGEVTGCNDVTPTPRGEWFCFEAHVQQSEHLLVETYINETALTYQSIGKPLVETVDLGGPVTDPIDHLRLGMFSHDSSGRGDVWIDDVAVATERVGCAD